MLAALTTSTSAVEGATLRGSEKQHQHQLQTRRLNKGKGQPPVVASPGKNFLFSKTAASEAEANSNIDALSLLTQVLK